MTEHPTYRFTSPPRANALAPAAALAEQLRRSATSLETTLDVLSRRPEPVVPANAQEAINEELEAASKALYDLECLLDPFMEVFGEHSTDCEAETESMR